ncbi:hypothetical protein [Carboxylicivirga sp. RSCT41]|uniref:hypothetical protein n=1 Tax=Carboxylicivirga agarovorans TaxID=3417570 RepID=UPI003D33C4F2
MIKKTKSVILSGMLAGLAYYMMRLLLEKMESGNIIYGFLCLVVLIIMLVKGGNEINNNYKKTKTRILSTIILLCISAMFILSILQSYNVLVMPAWFMLSVFGMVSVLCIVLIWHLKQSGQLFHSSNRNDNFL